MSLPCQWHSRLAEGMYESPADSVVWWEEFCDPTLTSLIERAAEQNLDLAIAVARVCEARVQIRGGLGALLPCINGSAAYGHAQFNQNMVNEILGQPQNGSTHKNANIFEIGFDADWEIDLFGRGIHQSNAQKARACATLEDYHGAWVMLSAEIARTYIELRGYQQRLCVLNKNIEAQKDTVELTEGLVASGFASSSDRCQTEEQLNLLSAQKPLLELAISKSIHRISILLGRCPSDLFDELCEARPLPQLPCLKPVGVPSELLRRRPDIRKAERELAAATEDVGVSVASLFPRLSLQGFIGDLSSLHTGGFTWYGGGALLWPVLNSSLIGQEIAASKFAAQAACYQYQKVVLEALEETENAIAALNAEMERRRYLVDAEASSRSSYESTLQQYERGLKDYLQVLIVNRSSLLAEDASSQSHVSMLLDYVALYKALGGSWQCSCQ